VVHKRSGFTLIEVLIFVSIISFFFVFALVATTAALRAMKINEHKIIATRYAEELQAYVRSKKEENWITFAKNSAVSPGTTWCFNDSPISPTDNSWPSPRSQYTITSGQTCSPCNIGAYSRTLTLTSTSTTNPTQVDSYVSVTWSEYGQIHSVTSSSTYTIWEN